MSTTTPDNSQALRHKLATLRDDARALAHMAEVLFAETGKLIEQWGISSGQTTSASPNSAAVCRQVIANGRPIKVAPAKLSQYLRRCKADLVVDLRNRPQVRLRHGKTIRTILLEWADAPILRVGLNLPGSVFGHRLLRTLEDNCEMNARSLTHRMAALTKVLQGGGTEGPFIQRMRVGLDISLTKWGYRFIPGPKLCPASLDDWHFFRIPMEHPSA